jgi:hypothetical protein
VDDIPAHFERIARLKGSGVKALIVRSALNPILWLCAIVSPPFLVAAYWFRESPVICLFLIITAAVPVFCACIGFAGFGIFQPDRLQSEEFQVMQQYFALLQQKGPVALEAAALKAIENPLTLAISTTATTPHEPP